MASAESLLFQRVTRGPRFEGPPTSSSYIAFIWAKKLAGAQSSASAVDPSRMELTSAKLASSAARLVLAPLDRRDSVRARAQQQSVL